jgi:O-antigen ligase
MPTLTSALIPFLLITLPWLNPFTMGPTPAVVPLLFSWACALGLVGFVILTRASAKPKAPSGEFVLTVASAWWAAATLSALFGLLQYFGATEALSPWVNSTQMGEAYANLRQRNQFATLCNIGFAALMWSVLHRPAHTKQRVTLSPVGALASAVLLQMGNAASASRTGLLQLVLLLVLFGLWGAWRSVHARRVLVAAILAYVVAALALPLLLGLDPLSSGMLARLHEGDPLCASRLTMWRNVLHLIAQKPLLGWGWGELDYAHFITLYSGPRFCEILDNAHNLPLQLAVELGIPAALACCTLGGWAVWRAKPWREKEATRQMAWAVVAVIMLHSLLEYPLWYGPFQMALGLSVWLLWRSADNAAPNLKQISPATSYLRARTALFLIASLLAGIGYAAWDYKRISQIYITPRDRMLAYRDNTLQKISDSWLYQGQVEFATLATLALSPENAAQMNRLAKSLLHFSPEPRVIESVIESAKLLGRADEVTFYRTRYQAAFPEKYATWVLAQ